MPDTAATIELLPLLLQERNVSTTDEENEMNTALVLAALENEYSQQNNEVPGIIYTRIRSSARMLRKIFRAEASWYYDSWRCAVHQRLT
jgi:hypothetical protein